jgi:hypothetical protein
MDNLVLTNMIFDGIGLAAVVLGLALASCLPSRHVTRPWVRTEDAQPKPAV